MGHYNNSHHFPGAHTPTEQEVKTWYAPLAMKMLMEFPKKEERYFRHFKGGTYKYIHSAFDSETQERCISGSLWRKILLGQTGKDVFRDYRKRWKKLFKVYGDRHLSV